MTSPEPTSTENPLLSRSSDPGCICHGNWRAIVAKYSPLLDRRYLDSKGKAWTFFGIVHGEDDYYYGMCREGGIELLSCVGDIESFGYTLLDKPTAGDLLPESEVVKLFSPERGFKDKAQYPYVEGEWTQEKGAEAFLRAINRSEAWRETRRLIQRLRHLAPADSDDAQKGQVIDEALQSAEDALRGASDVLSNTAGYASTMLTVLNNALKKVVSANELLRYDHRERPQSLPGEEGKGVHCPHCNGSGKESQVYEEETGWSPEGPCQTCKGTGRLYTAEQYIATLPADYRKDSSLETWFPLTAEELKRLREENAQLKQEKSLDKTL